MRKTPMRRTPMKRGKPMKRGTTRVGAAARKRVQAGGPRVKGRHALPLKEWRALVADLTARASGRCENPWHFTLGGQSRGVLDPQHVPKASQPGARDDADHVMIVCRFPCHNLMDNVADDKKITVEPLGEESFRVTLPDGRDYVYRRPL